MSAAVGSGLADRSGSLAAGRVVRAPPHRGGRSMAETTEAFVGIDVAKLRNAVAVADAGRDGEVRFHGEVDASPESMRRLAAKLAGTGLFRPGWPRRPAFRAGAYVSPDRGKGAIGHGWRPSIADVPLLRS